MRLYEKTNGRITLIDFSSPQLSDGKLVIKLSNNNQFTYHVCILRNNEIRLYDILSTEKTLSLSSHYQTYSNKNNAFLRLGKTERISFSIPTDYSLTPQQQDILQIINRVQNLKQELTNSNANSSLPDLLIKSYHEHSLSFIEIALTTLDLQQLKNALAIHWDNINGNALCYTALPNDPITGLFCDIAKFLASQLNSEAISLLMPTVSTESQFNDFPDLTTVDLQTILSTHILGENGAYLIPVTILSKREMKTDAANDYPTFEISTIDPNKLVSPYYQYDRHGEHPYLNATTQKRLFSFCPETEVIFDAITQHEQFIQNDQNLLGQLVRLTRCLKENSIEGSGHELEAGKNGFVAITTFFEYYNQLTSTQQSTIPKDIKDIIRKILRYGTEPTRSSSGSIVDRATEIDTCIASISTDLSVALSSASNQKLLSNIGISKQKTGKLLRQLQMQFQYAQMDLYKKIQNNCHEGRDPLNITHNILTLLSLENQFHIDSEDELDEFMKLSPNEIFIVCKEMPHIQCEITELIDNIENLFFLIFKYPEEKISKLLQAISTVLFDIDNGILTTPESFGLILRPFENGKFDMLLSIFSDQLHTTIQTASDLLALITPLNNHQRKTLHGKLIDILPKLIEHIYNFNYLAKELDETNLAKFYESSKNNLVCLIKNAHNFRQVTQYLNTAQRTDFYALCKIKLPTLIKNGLDFERLTTDLNDAQRCEIFEKIQHRLLWLITEALDFNYLTKSLNTEKKAILFNSVKDSLPRLIDTTYNFFLVAEHLNPTQQFFICAKLHNNLPNLLKVTLLLDSDNMAMLNRVVERYLVTRFFELFPSLHQGSIVTIQNLVRETASATKNQSRFFSGRSHVTAALREIGITKNLQEVTVLFFHKQITTYLSEMEKSTKSGAIRRQRNTV